MDRNEAIDLLDTELRWLDEEIALALDNGNYQDLATLREDRMAVLACLSELEVN